MRRSMYSFIYLNKNVFNSCAAYMVSIQPKLDSLSAIACMAINYYTHCEEFVNLLDM